MTVEPLIQAAADVALPAHVPADGRSAHPQVDLAHMAVEVAMLRAETDVLTTELVACSCDRVLDREAITLAHAATARLRRALVACLDSGALPVGIAYQARTTLATVPIDLTVDGPAAVRDTPPLASV